MRYFIAIALCFSALSAHAGSQALSTSELNDETRASIVKQMTTMKRFGQGKPERRRGGGEESSCEMDVGSTDSRRGGSRSARRNVTVVTGDVVQICK